MIGVRRYGSGPPLVALHGFTLTGEQFASASPLLGRSIIAPDLPGHGQNRDASAKLPDVIRFVETTLLALGFPVPLMGYSQGGRLALMAALDQPESISALVLISANAGFEDTNERATRARSDSKTAGRIEALPIDEFLDSWVSTGITSTDHLSIEDRETDMAVRRQNTPQGLANALVGYGQGVQPSVWHRLRDLTMPVLVMSGGCDEKYSIIADDMARTIPKAERVTIEHAGHNPILDSPDQAYGAISAFLDGLGRPGRPVVETSP